MYHVLDLLESLVPVFCGISMEGKNPPRAPWGLHLKQLQGVWVLGVEFLYELKGMDWDIFQPPFGQI